MLVGHVGAALLAKQVRPHLPLGTAIAAATLPDLLLFGFVLSGLEQVAFRTSSAAAPYFVLRHAPLSHSLVMTLVWGAALAAAYVWRAGDRHHAIALCTLVVSHWVLDIIGTPPFLPLAPGVAMHVGWAASPWLAGTMAIEAAFWAGALILYVTASRSADSAGRYVFWGGVVALTGAWYLNATRARPTPAADAPIEAAILLLMYIGWGVWMDRARTMKER